MSGFVIGSTLRFPNLYGRDLVESINIMGAVKYVPQITCVKCGKPVTDIRRVHSPTGNRRYIEARCHGETVEVPFADDTETEVKVFAPS